MFFMISRFHSASGGQAGWVEGFKMKMKMINKDEVGGGVRRTEEKLETID
jgi:hypothetical protein